MNPITPWLVCFALFLMLAFAVYAAIKTQKKNLDEIKRLEAELVKQKQNMAYLIKHKDQKIKSLEEALEAQKKVSSELIHYAEEIGKINGDQQNISEQINEAENDEEVLSIIAGLVHTNNDRVRK